MRRAGKVLPPGTWAAAEETGTVTLPCADRHRRRIVLTLDQGGELLLDLAEAAHLLDGTGLVVDGGGVVRVVAAEEAVADLYPADSWHLARLAWHLGNRHLPMQVMADGSLRIGHDHVIEAMAEGLGARVVRRRAPFQPEGGAYDGQAAAGHHHHAHHDHDHDHDHHHHHHG